MLQRLLTLELYVMLMLRIPRRSVVNICCTVSLNMLTYCWLFYRMDGPHSMLPARRVTTRLLSCYYKQELVWIRRQRWGVVLVKIVFVILNSTHIVYHKVSFPFVYSTLSQFVMRGWHYTQWLLNSNIFWSWTTEYLWWLLILNAIFCNQQNLATQSCVNMASGSMCVHIQKLFAKPNFTEWFH